jgi:hypothetical protein
MRLKRRALSFLWLLHNFVADRIDSLGSKSACHILVSFLGDGITVFSLLTEISLRRLLKSKAIP